MQPGAMIEYVTDCGVLAALITTGSLRRWLQQTPGLRQRRQYVGWRIQDARREQPPPAAWRDEVWIEQLYKCLKEEYGALRTRFGHLAAFPFPDSNTFGRALKTPPLKYHAHGTVPANEGSGKAVFRRGVRRTSSSSDVWFLVFQDGDMPLAALADALRSTVLGETPQLRCLQTSCLVLTSVIACRHGQTEPGLHPQR